MNKYKETIKRALRTFVQAAAGYAAANMALIAWGEDTSTVKSAVIGLITAAVACGISAVMNLPNLEKTNNTEENDENFNENDN